MNPTKAILIIASSILVQACGEADKSTSDQPSTKSSSSFSTEGKTALVYTTASGTDLRLTVTDTVTFAAAQQPLEGNISVFVNPEKTFQDFIGIGGAISTRKTTDLIASLLRSATRYRIHPGKNKHSQL